MNIINAIYNVGLSQTNEIANRVHGHNRANNMGEALEEYVKDLFAGTLYVSGVERNLKHSECFSYLGNQNNPPDIILRGGDAIEVKKIDSKNSSLALNSSYPKAKLFADSPMITTACRNCEEWAEKDIIYAVGVLKNDVLSSLCFVYGADFAASADTYERIKDVIRGGVNSVADVEFADTKELGRVNRVDPLGITHLRVRGMWGIDNPMRVFRYVYNRDDSRDFNFMALIDEDKYNSFDNTCLLEAASAIENNHGFNISDVKIKTPDNPAALKPAKLITFSR